MFVLASCLLVVQCVHHLLVVRTGKCFPTSRSRTSSCTPLTPSLFFVRKCDLHLLFCLTADCQLPNESKPERELVTLTTGVAVPHYKTVHNRKINEKVKQMVPSIE